MTSAGLRLITRYEGYRSDAYPDSLHGWKVPTIGYGTTRYTDGLAVRPGDRLSEAKARRELAHHVDTHITPQLRRIPGWDGLPEACRGALESFAYNVGANFYGSASGTTLSRALAERRWEDVPEALLLYRNPGTPVEAGLAARRRAEGAAWRFGLRQLELGKKRASQDGILLDVPYYSQRDSEVPGQAHRMCFSSSCAMLVSALRPEALGGKPNADDHYLYRVRQFGDTTEVQAQLKALASYRIDADFRKNLDWKDVDQQLEAGIPVPIGILHHGPMEAPAPGGHWILVVGWTANRQACLVHDPYGELDVVRGGYLHADGRARIYSRRNLGRRWKVEGPHNGWGILARP